MTDLAQAILAALQSGPKDTTELKVATGGGGSTLGNTLFILRRDGLISREAKSWGRWRYYIGNTAPTPEPTERKPTTYRVPVRQIEVPRYAEYCRNTQAAPQMIRITLPAEPWGPV